MNQKRLEELRLEELRLEKLRLEELRLEEGLDELTKICENPENPIKDKYPFMRLAIKKKYLEAAIINETKPFGLNPNFYHLAPENKDITFLEFAMVRVEDIGMKQFNPARKHAIDGETISGIEQIISIGAYCGWAHMPPVINEKGELIAGYARLLAHINGSSGYIWVAICKFKDDAAEFDYNEIENQIGLEFEKRYSSYDDILSSTQYGLQEKYYTLEDVPERVHKQRLKRSERMEIIQTIQKENGVNVDLPKNVSRSEVFSEYRAKKKRNLDFVASISVRDNPLNNARFRKVIVALREGKNRNLGITFKYTNNLKHLNEERDRFEIESSVAYIYNDYKMFTNAVESGRIGKLFLNYPKQYQKDEWKLDIETENV